MEDWVVVIFIIAMVIVVGSLVLKLIFLKHNTVMPLSQLSRKSLYELKE